MVQHQLCVSPIHIAIPIEIVIRELTGIFHDRLAVHRKFHRSVHGSGQDAEIAETTGAGLCRLSKDIRGELVSALRIRQIM